MAQSDLTGFFLLANLRLWRSCQLPLDFPTFILSIKVIQSHYFFRSVLFKSCRIRRTMAARSGTSRVRHAGAQRRALYRLIQTIVHHTDAVSHFTSAFHREKISNYFACRRRGGVLNSPRFWVFFSVSEVGAAP